MLEYVDIDVLMPGWRVGQAGSGLYSTLCGAQNVLVCSGRDTCWPYLHSSLYSSLAQLGPATQTVNRPSAITCLTNHEHAESPSQHQQH